MWYIEFIIGNMIRQYTERDPGEALRKIFEEFGTIQNECVGQNYLPIRIRTLAKLGS